MQFASALLFFLGFILPIDYCKTFNHFSRWLIPEHLNPTYFETRFALYTSDLLILALLLIYRPRLLNHPIWLVLLCALVSIMASPFAFYLTPYLHLIHLFLALSLFSCFYNEKIDVRPLLTGLMVAGLIQAGVAILQTIHDGPLGLRFLGECKHSAHAAGHFRACGTFPHPNIFGSFLLLSIAATVSLKKKWPLLFLTLALFLTLSRSALIGLTVFSLLNRKYLISFGLTALALSSHWLGRGSFNNRVFYSNLSWDIIPEHPLFGLGYMQYLERAKPFIQGPLPDEYITPHNIYLLLACETGLLSLLIFVLSGLSLLRIRNTPFFALFIAFALIGCFDDFFLTWQRGLIMLFLSASLLANTRHTARISVMRHSL